MLFRAACRGDAARGGATMPQYRCYLLDSQDHVTSFKVFDLPDDNLAQTEADSVWRTSGGHGFELWNGLKMIHREVKPA
jgi:hypothetical protein